MGSFGYVLPGIKAYAMAAVGADAVIPYSADYLRRFMGAVYNNQGVRELGDWKMTPQSSPNWTFKLTSGNAFISRTAAESTNPEMYMVSNPSSSLTVDLGGNGISISPAGLRTHKIYLAVYDKAYFPASTYHAKIFVAEDTGSGAAAAPTDSPVGFLSLGTVTIGPSQSFLQTADLHNDVKVAGFYQKWINLTYASGIGDPSGGTTQAQYQRIGKTVRLRGAAQRSGAAKFASGPTTLFTTTPAEAQPVAVFRYLPVACQYSAYTDPVTARLAVGTNISVHMSGHNVADTVWLDGVSYDID